jgi:histone-lysine N-methyltransferase SETMAR
LVASLTSFAPLQFLERIVTGDETWVHLYEPESKAQSTAWKRPTSPVAKKFKSQPSAGKIMLTLFWDMESGICVHFTTKGETVNSQNYCDVLQKKLKPATRSRHREKLRKDAILLHDNPCPHMTNQTVETVNKMGCELMEHLPFRPDLASSNFHMFRPMKQARRGRRISSDEEVTGAVQNLLKTQP